MPARRPVAEDHLCQKQYQMVTYACQKASTSNSNNILECVNSVNDPVILLAIGVSQWNYIYANANNSL